jgi:hypothetical protein
MHVQPTAAIEKPAPTATKTTSPRQREVEHKPAANSDEKHWLWVRCASEPGPLSSELVATVRKLGASSDHSSGSESGDEVLWSETQLWCSYRSPEDVYQLIAELVQSGVIIREVRKVSSDLRTWQVRGEVC